LPLDEVTTPTELADGLLQTTSAAVTDTTHNSDLRQFQKSWTQRTSALFEHTYRLLK